ncbi:MAG: hypothetical protein KDK70_19705 [Myxococcales bacterium]|nr:hypothetical protein [Myxococcales bacterium]
MAKNNYSAGKRARERDRERKKKEKAQRRAENRGGGGDVPTATVDELQGGKLMSIEEVMRNMQGTAESEHEDDARTIPSRLFVGGLDWRITDDQLRQEFAKLGSVDEAIVVLDRDTGDSRGFGFVTMSDRRDAAEAIRRLHGTQFEGRTLVVRQAEERRSRR